GEAGGVRIVAREDSRGAATRYAPGAATPEQAQREAYAVMPDEELFSVERVVVPVPEADRPGRPRSRVFCSACGERVNDSRELNGLGGGVLCRACAGAAYYRRAADHATVGTPGGG
ncbi:MAG TPA: formylmethanofuran dehydrogenase, partial [Chloroflexota bacterium]|nr:formylmethanofuran dehydrogenase [Chloroflexota bacterium]